MISPSSRMVRALCSMFLFLFPISSPPALYAGDPYSDHNARYSQFNEDKIIRHYFKDRRGGFFLDVGCAHPVTFSTTYYLEKHLGWKGIGIDALAEYGPQFKALRPGTKFLNYAVTDRSGGTTLLYIGKTAPKGWSTITGSGKRLLDDPRAVPVKKITLNDILKKEKVRSIDLLSMDIEDAEPLALAGFDIERFKPKLVCIEAHRTVRKSPKRNKKCAS